MGIPEQLAEIHDTLDTHEAVVYVPAVAADWTDSTPASLGAALDELAGRIHALEDA